MSVARLEQITKTYRLGDRLLPVLKGVSLTIEKGEFVSIMGPSGSGKSTLLHILGCLDVPTSGTYVLEGETISDARAGSLVKIRRSRIGFIFQSFHLLPRLTAWQNVALPLVYAGGGNRKARALDVLRMVGMEDRADHRPRQLSGGEQQRVAIARALVSNPALLLADEPTGNLDSANGTEILRLFHTLHARGSTIVLVTHDHSLAAQTQRRITLRDGLVVPSS